MLTFIRRQIAAVATYDGLLIGANLGLAVTARTFPPRLMHGILVLLLWAKSQPEKRRDADLLERC